MQNNIKKIDDGRILLVLSEQIYSREMILNTSYKFAGKLTISIGENDQKNWEIFLSKGIDAGDDWEKTVYLFCDKLIEQQVREDIKDKTKHIRDVIVKHAFSPIGDLNKELSEKPCDE